MQGKKSPTCPSCSKKGDFLFLISTDYGKSFHDISHRINNTFIREEFGLSVGPRSSVSYWFQLENCVISSHVVEWVAASWKHEDTPQSYNFTVVQPHMCTDADVAAISISFQSTFLDRWFWQQTSQWWRTEVGSSSLLGMPARPLSSSSCPSTWRSPLRTTSTIQTTSLPLASMWVTWWHNSFLISALRFCV